MTAEEKLKEIEKTCESWKLIRAMGLNLSDDIDSFTVIERASNQILKIIKESE